MDIARIRKKLKAAKKKKSSKTASPDSEDIKEARNNKSLAAKETETPGKSLTEIGGDEVSVWNEDLPDGNYDNETDEMEEPVDLVEFLKFNLGGDAYAFRVSAIEEILRPQRLTAIPRTDPYVLGITSFRGKIIPVVDLGKKFAAEEIGSEGFSKSKIVILRGPKDSIGVPVEGSMDVILLAESDIKEPPPHISENERRLVEGVVMINDVFVTIMRLEEVLDFNMTGEA